MKYILMSAVLITAMLPGLSLSCDDHHGKCEIEDWKHSHNQFGEILSIQGVTTCNKGFIRIRMYDSGKFHGIAEALVEGHIFEAISFNVPKPSALEIKYSIEPE